MSLLFGVFFLIFLKIGKGFLPDFKVKKHLHFQVPCVAKNTLSHKLLN